MWKTGYNAKEKKFKSDLPKQISQSQGGPGGAQKKIYREHLLLQASFRLTPGHLFVSPEAGF